MNSLSNILKKNPLPLIIAEIGVNHDGNVQKALDLSLSALENGADIVKFQYWKTEVLQNEKYTDKELLKNLVKWELNIEELKYLKKEIETHSGIFLCTADEENSAIELKEILNMDWIKIGSGEIDNYFFLDFIKNNFKGIILSTGASNEKVIKGAIEIIKGMETIVLMHTVSCYPTKTENIDLNRINMLKEMKNINAVGFSDHSVSIYPAIASIAMGVRIIEKHYTFSRDDEGPDHKASIIPEELKRLREGVNDVWLSLQENKNTCEKENAKIFRKGAYWRKDKKKGELFSAEDVIIQRPNVGMDIIELFGMLGNRLDKDIKKGDPIRKGDIFYEKE